LRLVRPFLIPGWVLSALAGSAVAAPPSVILVSIDTLRADRLGCHGHAGARSPAIDALAAGGHLFTGAVSAAPWTLPAHASLMTSLHARTHRTDDAKRSLPDGATTLAATLRDAGYSTHAVVSGPFMRSEFGLHAGFDTYDESLARGKHEESHGMITSDRIHERALALLDDAPAPFFLFLHYWDVHYDYIPPDPYAEIFDPGYQGDLTGEGFMRNRRIRRDMPAEDLRHLRALYDGEVAWVDRWIGRLLRELESRGLLDEVVVVLTADHGDEFFEHGERGHQHSLYEELVHVPLIVRLPADPGGGRRHAARVELVDVMPTLLDILGVAPPAGLQGRSLGPLLRGGTLADRPAYAETTKAQKDRSEKRRSRSWCVYDGPLKLIVFDGKRHPTELYDLDADPAERRDLGADPRRARLVERWESWMRTTPEGREQANAGVDEATRRTLESLGYVGD